jgi:hypothetical protein
MSEARGRFFEKKLRKKLLRVWAIGLANSRLLRSKSFLRAFFQKSAFFLAWSST